MPTKTLDGKDAVLVSLAMQKEATLKQQAAQAFASDVALVVADLGATGSVSFKIDGGQVTAEWTDEHTAQKFEDSLARSAQGDVYEMARRQWHEEALQNAAPTACKQCANPLLKGLHTCGMKG